MRDVFNVHSNNTTSSRGFIHAIRYRDKMIQAAFEQSLPWADIVETRGFGHIAWYSQDVMPWPHSHVECIALATSDAIANKYDTIKEVMHHIHVARQNIDKAGLKRMMDLAIEAVIFKHTVDINAFTDPCFRHLEDDHTFAHQQKIQ